jgi:DNA-binding transcriptional MerR regulator
MEKLLPSIPVKRYFTIGEVSDLCGVKPYVLRYWEQEFTQLKPMKRRGNRRYYQHHEVLLIRRIRELLYDEGFTISGARNRLSETGSPREVVATPPGLEVHEIDDANLALAVSEMVSAVASSAFSSTAKASAGAEPVMPVLPRTGPYTLAQLREELISIRALLA